MFRKQPDVADEMPKYVWPKQGERIMHLFGEEWNNGDRLKTQWDQPHPNGTGNVERGNINVGAASDEEQPFGLLALIN